MTTRDENVAKKKFKLETVDNPFGEEGFSKLSLVGDKKIEQQYALKAIESSVKALPKKVNQWLLIKDKCGQPVSRIVLYKKILKNIKGSGIDVSCYQTTKEWSSFSDNKVTFRCGLLVRSNIAQIVDRLSHLNYDLSVIYVEDDRDVDDVVSGWDEKEPSIQTLYSSVVKYNGLIANCFGMFDDHEWGVNVIGRKEKINLLKKHLKFNNVV
ncbi:hypothetical protein ACSEE7_12100 [Halomonas cupida]|uniref:hypothetical protein n=1 Tax=Halomonas TaxID=2745 RepID=UPI001C96E029|nr:hypothetical protein [Halomonas sp. DP8Y7-3]MBY5927597.1 hypothetical protein [Halomonas sp. DP8Y7-3]